MAGRKPTVADEEFLRAMLNADGPVASTSEIQSAVGFNTSKGARDRLNDLESEGLVGAKKIGKSQAWWLTDAGLAFLEEQG